jgi:hypothetical protein
VRLKSKGVHFMYPSHLHLHYFVPSSQEADVSSTPYPAGDYSNVPLDERQFGSFFPQMPPPPGPPGSHQPSDYPHVGPPTSPPPSIVPQQTHQAGAYAVDPGSMVRCLHRYTYVWQRGFEQFWFYPTFIGRHSVSGYRWTGHRWVNYGVSLRQIQSFTCV